MGDGSQSLDLETYLELQRMNAMRETGWGVLYGFIITLTFFAILIELTYGISRFIEAVEEFIYWTG